MWPTGMHADVGQAQEEQTSWPELVGAKWEHAQGVIAADGKQPQRVPEVRCRLRRDPSLALLLWQ